MDRVFENESFAVVDLETTGTRMEEGHRIIQFGCAIIKKRRVVKTYSFMMNPHAEIPLAVTNLTGITNKMVRDKPDFTHYAKQITDILKDKIFVAHNVNFDFPFLNYELTSAGFDALTNRAIDTVELAKIAFPTEPSYKLQDLTSSLGIEHKDPHKADSDAYGTAVLLLKIIEKIEGLPQATLNVLGSLSTDLVRDTGYVISEIANESRKVKRKLPKDKMQVRNLILKKQKVASVEEGRGDTFPESNQDKKVLFEGKINYRRAQVALINKLHEYLQNYNKQYMMVEAPNGTGKTFAYLFAYAYQLYSGQKLVVATPTKVLQEQIINQEIPQLLHVTGLSLTAEVVKASSHYLDLDGFAQTLYQPTPNKATLLLQMQILVWLTETTTGDLDELQLTSEQLPIFTQIKHPGDARVGTYFSEVDFWNLARRRQEQANILVTNHAYLVNHYTDTIWGQNPYLVVDEAHRFVDNLITSRNDNLRFESLWGVITHLRNMLFYTDNIFSQEDDAQLNFMLDSLDKETNELIHTINHLQRSIYQRRQWALNEEVLANKTLQLTIQGVDLFPESSDFRLLLREFQKKIEQVRQDVNQVLYQLYQESDSFLTDDVATVSDLSEQIDLLDYYIEKSYQLADLINQPEELKHLGFVVSITNPGDALSTNLHWMMLDNSEELYKIYDRFDHLCFVSATMTNDGKFEFAKKRLFLEDRPVETYVGQATFDMNQHLEIYAVDENQPQPDSPAFSNLIHDILTKDLNGQNHVLVLFTNLDLIRQVYLGILNESSLKDYELLAQGLTGSNERIAKRFGIAKKSILLGADSFWEGIDFHDCSVDLVIVVRLPFEAPDAPEVRLRQNYLMHQGVDIFMQDSLPRAIMRLSQGCGRIIRGEQDYGKLLILDSRIWTKSYGDKFISSLPVNVKKLAVSDLKAKLKNVR